MLRSLISCHISFVVYLTHDHIELIAATDMEKWKKEM